MANNLAVPHSLARRFLKGRSREPLMRFIARISMTGMALAVAVLVLVLSVMNGFEKEFRERILSLVPHATLIFSDANTDYSTAANRLQQFPSVKSVVPFVQVDALALGKRQAEPLLIFGLPEAELQHKYQDFVDTMDMPKQGEILLGKKLASKLGLEVGDAFRVLRSKQGAAPNILQSRASAALTGETLTLVGTVATGTELDTALALMRLELAAELKHGNQNEVFVDGFLFSVSDIFQARSVVSDAAYEVGLSGSLVDWTRQYGNLYMAIQLSRQMVVILLAAIVAIAAFNIFVTLGMSVRHRQKEIAILRSLGMTRGSVLFTFCLKGLYIFFPGFVVGAILGVIIALLAPGLVGLLEAALGIEFLNTDVYPIDYLPVEIRPSDLVFIFFSAFVISLLATVLPAWRAAALQPAQVLN